MLNDIGRWDNFNSIEGMGSKKPKNVLTQYMDGSLGKTTANYRWFAIFYLTNMFFVVPAIVIGLSLAGNVIFFSVITPALIIFLGVIFINVAQVKIPHKLPEFLTNWDFLPLWMHSLDPLDNLLRYICCGFSFCNKYAGVQKTNDDDCPATPPNSDFYEQ